MEQVMKKEDAVREALDYAEAEGIIKFRENPTFDERMEHIISLSLPAGMILFFFI